MVLPELARVLRPDGVSQLMFKNGEGVLTMFDKDYRVERNLQLFDGAELLAVLEGEGMKLIHSDRPDQLGGSTTTLQPGRSSGCRAPGALRPNALMRLPPQAGSGSGTMGLSVQPRPFKDAPGDFVLC